MMFCLVGWVKRRFAAPTHRPLGCRRGAVGRRGEAPLDPPYKTGRGYSHSIIFAFNSGGNFCSSIRRTSPGW
jgi:hypothetical protein